MSTTDHASAPADTGNTRRSQFMFHFTQFRNLAGGIALAAALSACGGGNDGVAPEPSPSPAAISSFATVYASALAGTASFAGLNSGVLADQFDGAFLDGGIAKADVMAAIQAEAQAAAVSPDFPGFAQVALSGVTVTNCDTATQVCTLTGTLTNSDADTTSVSFTTQVKMTDKVRLYGDQSKS
jgi:hypothetical protein